MTDEEDRDNVDLIFELRVNAADYNRQFSEEEKRILRPIAETLAMLDGNAFLSMKLGSGASWYEQYLPEAHSLFKSNGGREGWAGELSWIKEEQHENDSVKAAYENWRMLKSLSRGDDDAEDNSRPF